jgi:glycine/D-amino acid oxidase-like deaminating enzyme
VHDQPLSPLLLQLLHWEAMPGGGVEVTTDKGRYKADKLVLSSGAWLHKQVPELEVGPTWLGHGVSQVPALAFRGSTPYCVSAALKELFFC